MVGCGSEATPPKVGQSGVPIPSGELQTQAEGSAETPDSQPLDLSESIAAFEWQDPEPPEAQELAEQVLRSEWNRDKTLTFEGTSTRLQMHMTTLKYPTSALQGFGSQVVSDVTSLEDRLQELGAEVTDLEVTIRLAGSILFDFDRAEIRMDAYKTLKDVATVLEAYEGAPIRIEGHTDGIGGDAYNQTLSLTRAQAVHDWLVDAGVNAGHLTQLGHGETQPIATNDTADGRQLNRRVEIVVERDRSLTSGA